MIPCREDLEKLARNMKYKDACTLDCNKCDWQKEKQDCVTLARIEIGKLDSSFTREGWNE